MTVEKSDLPSLTATSLEFDLPIDAGKAKEIQACLANGRLRISLSPVDLATGRLGDGYKYD